MKEGKDNITTTHHRINIKRIRSVEKLKAKILAQQQIPKILHRMRLKYKEKDISSAEDLAVLKQSAEQDIVQLCCTVEKREKKKGAARKKINMQEKQQNENKTVDAGAEEALSKSGKKKSNSSSDMMKVKDAEGKIYQIPADNILCVNGQNYIFVRRDHAFSLRALLEAAREYYSFSMQLLPLYFLFFYMNKFMIAVSIIYLLMALITKLKVNVIFKRGEHAKNVLKHFFCFFISLFLNPGQNLTVQSI